MTFNLFVLLLLRMTNIATIQKVKNVRHCPDSDNLDILQVLGWQIVCKRNEFAEGDLCVYIVIDSVLPERAEFEFLRNKHFRIKPIRLRKQESAGIVFPLSILSNFGYDITGVITEGTDLTEVIGVKHYSKPLPAQLAGQAIGNFPGFLKITDEDNLRSYPDAVPEMYGRPFYITRKDDGCSGTFFNNAGEFGVCSRRIHLKDTEGNGFWQMARKYDIDNVLRKAFIDRPIAIQGECVGPGIQNNKLGLKEMEFHLFNIYDIVSRAYLDYDKLVEFTKTYNIPMVTVISEGNVYGHTLEDLIKLTNEQKYPTGGAAEGIVVRPKESFYSNALKKYWSGKIINENYKE